MDSQQSQLLIVCYDFYLIKRFLSDKLKKKTILFLDIFTANYYEILNFSFFTIIHSPINFIRWWFQFETHEIYTHNIHIFDFICWFYSCIFIDWVGDLIDLSEFSMWTLWPKKLGMTFINSRHHSKNDALNEASTPIIKYIFHSLFLFYFYSSFHLPALDHFFFRASIDWLLLFVIAELK